jgi:iron(III) transport system permease protein
MATSYIIGLVENGRYGVAIAYCSVLILVMLTAILVVNGLIGQRRLRREDRVEATPDKTSTGNLREKHS